MGLAHTKTMNTAPHTEKLVEALVAYAELAPVKTYLRRLNHPNFWTIVGNGRKSYETYYSKTLAWLLDPTANHGAQSTFAQKLIEKITEEDTPNKNQAPTSVRYNDLTVYRGADTEALGANIDVFYYDEMAGTAIVIEAKMGSLDHKAGTTEFSQLDKYHQAVESNPLVLEKCPNRYYLYLTVTGAEPTISAHSKDQWITVSYETIAEVAREFLFDLNDDGAVKIVRDFIFDLERHTELAGDRLAEAALPFKEDSTMLEQIRLMASTFTESGTDSTQASRLFDSVSRDIALHGINRQTLKHMIEALNETLMERKQDHTPSPLGQELIEQISETFTGKRLKPREVAPVLETYKIPGFIENMRRTQGKGQGLNAGLKDNFIFYISAGNYQGDVCLPQDPSKVQKEVFAQSGLRRKEWTATYWQSNFEQLIGYIQQSMQREYNAWLEQQQAEKDNKPTL